MSATVAINDRSNRLRREGREVFKLGLGQSPFPVPAPVVAALRANAEQKDYLPTVGLPELREAVAAHHQRTFGIRCRPRSVLIGPGSKELMFLLQLVYEGDILIPCPAWVSYSPQARIIGREVVALSTRAENSWKLMPEELTEVCQVDPGRRRVLVLNYPSNPTGTTYSEDELAALAEIARRYRVIVLSDEIYGKVHHEGRHHSIVPLYPEGSLFSGGLSKWCGAGGWRLGLFVVPDHMQWLVNAMASVASETFTSTSAPIQHAAVVAFQPSQQIDDYLVRCRRVLKGLGSFVHGRLEEAGAAVVTPMGGFYVFPDFGPLSDSLNRRGITSSQQLCERLLEETGVAILPGSEFGRPPDELTARLAYVDFDGADAVNAADGGAVVDEQFVRTHCGHTVRGVELLCDWLRNG